MHFQTNGCLIKSLAAAGLLLALTAQRASPQGHHGSAGGHHNCAMLLNYAQNHHQQLAMAEHFLQQHHYLGQLSQMASHLQQQHNLVHQHQVAQQLQHAFQQAAMHNQHNHQQAGSAAPVRPMSAGASFASASYPLQTVLMPTSQLGQMSSGFSNSSASSPFQAAAVSNSTDDPDANDRDANLRLATARALAKGGNPKTALHYAQQVVSRHPNSTQAQEAQTIIKVLTQHH